MTVTIRGCIAGITSTNSVAIAKQSGRLTFVLLRSKAWSASPAGAAVRECAKGIAMRLILVPALLSVFALCACLPVSSGVPVGSAVGFKADPALLGTWKARDADGDEPSYIHILGNVDGSMTALLVTPPHKASLGEWSAYTLHAAALGANRIVNAQESMSEGRVSSGPL